jgi:hypothetical protein
MYLVVVGSSSLLGKKDCGIASKWWNRKSPLQSKGFGRPTAARMASMPEYKAVLRERKVV